MTKTSKIGSEKRETGGAEGDRTPDLGIANAALSQLSYCPSFLEVAWLGVGQKIDKRPPMAPQNPSAKPPQVETGEIETDERPEERLLKCTTPSVRAKSV